MIIRLGALGITAALALVGCGDNIGTQTIVGRVSHGTFGSPVETVSVRQGTAVITEATVASDGAFTVHVPQGSNYRLHFSTSAERVGLISPRATGALDTSFNVRGSGAAFDLGNVRRIAQPLAHSYHDTSGDDQECEDGLDPTGAVCVDDQEGQQGQSCGNDDGETNDDGADQSDDQSDGDGETNDDQPETSTSDAAAVADRNLPPDMGCDQGDDGGDGDGETSDD